MKYEEVMLQAAAMHPLNVEMSCDGVAPSGAYCPWPRYRFNESVKLKAETYEIVNAYMRDMQAAVSPTGDLVYRCRISPLSPGLFFCEDEYGNPLIMPMRNGGSQ